jgi:hypothetical protein
MAAEIWLEVTTNRRSYCVRGHGQVAWAAAERVVSIQPVDPADRPELTDDEAYLERAAELDRRVSEGESITDIMRKQAAARHRATLERALMLDEADRQADR